MSLISVQRRSTSAALSDMIGLSRFKGKRDTLGPAPLTCRSASASRPLAAVLEFRRRLELVFRGVHRRLPDLILSVVRHHHCVWIYGDIVRAHSKEAAHR